jgi:predicted DNA-binding transcriptional regulator AlpA
VTIDTRLLDAKQAAALLGISERRFYQLRHEPNFPVGRQLGPRTVRYSSSELLEWTKSCPPATRVEPAQLQQGRVFRAGTLVAGG